MCLKQHGREGDLERHLKTAHGHSKKFRCDACLKRFVQRRHLNIHLKTVHCQSKEFQCETWLKRFGKKGYLDMHLKTIHVCFMTCIHISNHWAIITILGHFGGVFCSFEKNYATSQYYPVNE